MARLTPLARTNLIILAVWIAGALATPFAVLIAKAVIHD